MQKFSILVSDIIIVCLLYTCMLTCTCGFILSQTKWLACLFTTHSTIKYHKLKSFA